MSNGGGAEDVSFEVAAAVVVLSVSAGVGDIFGRFARGEFGRDGAWWLGVMDVGGGGVDTRLMTFSATVGNFECGRLFSEVISWRRSWLQPQKLTFQKCQSLFSTAAVASMCAPGRRVPGSGVRPEARGALGSRFERSTVLRATLATIPL